MCLDRYVRPSVCLSALANFEIVIQFFWKYCSFWIVHNILMKLHLNREEEYSSEGESQEESGWYFKVKFCYESITKDFIMLLVSMNFYKNMLTFRYLFLLKNVSTIPYFFKPFEFNSNATQIFFCFHLNCIFFHEFNRNFNKKE